MSASRGRSWARVVLAAAAVAAAWRIGTWWSARWDPYDVAPWGAMDAVASDQRPYVGFGDCRDAGARPKSPGEYLIVMSGGSTVWGFFEGPLPVLLARRFHEAGFPRVRVVNCGVRAEASSQELARLVFQIADLKPDLLLVYDGGNDMMQPLYADPRPGYPQNFILVENNPLFRRGETSLAGLLALRSPLLRRALARWLAERLAPLGSVRVSAGYGSARWRENIAETYARNVVKTAAVARGFGIRPVVALQPLIYDYHQGPGGPEPGRTQVLGPLFSDVSNWRGHAHDVRARILRLAARRAFGPWPTFWDMGSVLDGGPPVFEDYIHVTTAGDKIIADALFRRLRAIGVPPGR